MIQKPCGMIHFHSWGKCLCQCCKQYPFFHASFFPTEPISCHRSWICFLNFLCSRDTDIPSNSGWWKLEESVLQSIPGISSWIKKGERERDWGRGKRDSFLLLMFCEDKVLGFAGAILEPGGEDKSLLQRSWTTVSTELILDIPCDQTSCYVIK